MVGRASLVVGRWSFVVVVHCERFVARCSLSLVLLCDDWRLLCVLFGDGWWLTVGGWWLGGCWLSFVASHVLRVVLLRFVRCVLLDGRRLMLAVYCVLCFERLSRASRTVCIVSCFFLVDSCAACGLCCLVCVGCCVLLSLFLV